MLVKVYVCIYAFVILNAPQYFRLNVVLFDFISILVNIKYVWVRHHHRRRSIAFMKMPNESLLRQEFIAVIYIKNVYL